ncbi:RNA polymerase sigma-70 factor [Variovorax sp. E3]|uniref:RNA polymerase sigma-70 factor n=1 Tax=Variovorax sp. E3 TaxID=1914993 RepID=UPI0018DEB12E|nr:RNA polymerase sigma-70 factor [Variovorax sp. E3]
MNDTNDINEIFNELRPRLHGIAYRMLGSKEEAEDLVQDAWVRWRQSANGAADQAVDNPQAWLVSVVTHLAIDRLRAAKVEREHYIGMWLPEPVMPDVSPSPEKMLEQAENISIAFLTMLERLSPESRAAFLMREVFGASYSEISLTLRKSEAACRQLVHRAKMQLLEKRKRFRVKPEDHIRLLKEFAEAARRGDISALRTLLADDAEFVGDGGGKVQSFGVPLRGSDRIARLYYATGRRYGARVHMRIAPVNGEWGLLRFIDGELESVQSFETDDAKILRIQAQRNPEKLAALAAILKRGGAVGARTGAGTEPITNLDRH